MLLSRGLECLEELFPGFEADLVAAGAPVVEGSESLWLNAAGWCRRYLSPIRLLGASRALIEWQVRNRVTALDNVEVLERCEAVGLLGDHDRGGVTGVRLRSHGGHAEVTGPDTDVPADFVVDASGRGSRAPRWLAALGYQPPSQTAINSLLGYASRQDKIPANFQADWRMLVINAKPPGNARTGALVPIEGGRWMVALIGAGRDYPPADDTVMTAVALDHLLAEHRRRPRVDPSALASRFQRLVARTSAGAWTMATSEDLRYPWTEGARLNLPTCFMHHYADRVLEVTNGNPKVNTAFVNVVNLRHPPASLFRPRVLLPVLARRRAPPLTNPPTTRHEATPQR